MKTKDTVIFLDVDGVLNHTWAWDSPGHDLDHYQFIHTDPDSMMPYRVGVYFPKWMPELVQYLVEHYDVRWLTTWRESANEQLAPILGIPELPVISDGTKMRMTGWKHGTAAPIAEKLMSEGKRVIWIEDFYGRIPPMPRGTEFIDTGSRQGLFGDDVAELIPADLLDRTRPGFAPLEECGECFGTGGNHKMSCSTRGWAIPSCNLCEAPADFHETWCPAFSI